MAKCAHEFLRQLRLPAICAGNGIELGPPLCTRVDKAWSVGASHNLSRIQLSQALVVGSRRGQVRFATLSLEMFAVLQCLERRDEDETNSTGAVAAANGSSKSSSSSSGSSGSRSGMTRPHVLMMSQPTVPKLLHALSAAAVAATATHTASNTQHTKRGRNNSTRLTPTACVLLYLAADAIEESSKGDGASLPPVPGGGAEGARSASCVFNASVGLRIPAARRRRKGSSRPSRNSDISESDTCVLRPSDLAPFTRQPILIVVDAPCYGNVTSPVSRTCHLQSHRTLVAMTKLASESPCGQPVVVICAGPLPHSLQGNVDSVAAAAATSATAMDTDKTTPSTRVSRSRAVVGVQSGTLALFLRDPLAALCQVCGVPSLSAAAWHAGSEVMTQLLDQVTHALTQAYGLDQDTSPLVFMADDDHLRRVITHALACRGLLAHHDAFDEISLPMISPSPSDEFWSQVDFANFAKTLAKIINAPRLGNGLGDMLRL